MATLTAKKLISLNGLTATYGSNVLDVNATNTTITGPLVVNGTLTGTGITSLLTPYATTSSLAAKENSLTVVIAAGEDCRNRSQSALPRHYRCLYSRVSYCTGQILCNNLGTGPTMLSIKNNAGATVAAFMNSATLATSLYGSLYVGTTTRLNGDVDVAGTTTLHGNVVITGTLSSTGIAAFATTSALSGKENSITVLSPLVKTVATGVNQLSLDTSAAYTVGSLTSTGQILCGSIGTGPTITDDSDPSWVYRSLHFGTTPKAANLSGELSVRHKHRSLRGSDGERVIAGNWLYQFGEL